MIDLHANCAEAIVGMLTGDDHATKEPLVQDDPLLTPVTVPERAWPESGWVCRGNA